MSEDIKVHVVDYGRKCLYMRYRDPLTGKHVARSTGTQRRKDALKAAGQWQSELREGRYRARSKLSWADFRERYESEHVASLAYKTAQKVWATLDAVERIVSPNKLRDLDAASISHFASKLREDGKPEATVAGYLRHLKAALGWAVRVGMLHAAPTIAKPHRAKAQKLMKGRPVTGEEFDRLISAVPKVVVVSTKRPKKPEQLQADRERVESWRHLLRGLWWSGLRLGEALKVWWDREDRLHVDLSGKRPMLRIPACMEKGNRDRLLPIAPEFAEMLLATPEAERRGRVFNPAPRRRRGDRMTENAVSAIISDIGEKACVKVEVHPETGKVKHASAHDLRRSFGDRWARRVMPPVLMQLMRHESIETTLRHYVGRDAQATAEVLYEAVSGNTPGNTPSDSAVAAQDGESQPLTHAES